MKTAISVPDATFAEVERRAAELGMNRSEFYSVAAQRYLRELDEGDVTARLDEALTRSGEAARREALEFAAASQRSAHRLLDEEW